MRWLIILLRAIINLYDQISHFYSKVWAKLNRKTCFTEVKQKLTKNLFSLNQKPFKFKNKLPKMQYLTSHYCLWKKTEAGAWSTIMRQNFSITGCICFVSFSFLAKTHTKKHSYRIQTVSYHHIKNNNILTV